MTAAIVTCLCALKTGSDTAFLRYAVGPMLLKCDGRDQILMSYYWESISKGIWARIVGLDNRLSGQIYHRIMFRLCLGDPLS